MSELQQNRYDQLVRRLGDLKGPGSKVNDVITELLPTLDVESVPGELLALMGTRIAIGHTKRGGVAAVFNQSQLFNPAGSGKLITLTRVDLQSGTAQDIFYGLVTTALATDTGVARFRDGRFGVIAQPIGQTRFGTAGAVSPAVGIITTSSTPDQFLEDENGVFVLPPGFGAQFTCEDANTALTVGYVWRERQAEPSEFNF